MVEQILRHLEKLKEGATIRTNRIAMPGEFQDQAKRTFKTMPTGRPGMPVIVYGRRFSSFSKAADYLGCNKKTVARMVKTGKAKLA